MKWRDFFVGVIAGVLVMAGISLVIWLLFFSHTASYNRDGEQHVSGQVPGEVVATSPVSGGETVPAENQMSLPVVTPEDVQTKVRRFIKEKLSNPGGGEIKIQEFKEENGLYKITFSMGDRNQDAYVTKDGKKFFFGGTDLEKELHAPKPVTEVTVKKDVPQVELFTMSYCPFSMQLERGLLPVLGALGSKIQFDFRFVDYTLRGKKEFSENINQYCMRKEYPEYLLMYLACFNTNADSGKCMEKFHIDADTIHACVVDTDEQFKLSEHFTETESSSPFGIDKKLNEKYGVQGSPTLVINGQTVSVSRDSESLLKMICGGFENPPKECDQTLSSEVSPIGFGKDYTMLGK